MTPLAAAGAFAGRDFRVARSYKVAFAMTIASLAMSLLTFRFLAKLVGHAPQLASYGDYFSFVVVGLAMAQVLEGTISAPANAVRQEQVQGTLEVLGTTPMSPAALAAGWVSYPLAQSLFTGVVMIGFAGAMGLRFSQPSWIAAALAVVLSVACFAAIGILAAAVVVVIQQSAGLTRWISGGLALLSGVFFPLSVFPGWVGSLAKASPLTHSLHALRGALLEGRGLGAVGGDLLALFAQAVVLLPLAVGALALALRWARRRGTLAAY